jgi:uncharacterized protein YkwD
MFRLGRLLAIALIACTPRGPVRPASDAPADGAGTTTPTAATARDQVLAAATARFVAERAAPIHDVALDAVALVVANSASTGYVVATAGLRTALATHLGTGLDPYVLTARGDGAAIVAQLAPALAELRGAAGIAAVGVAAVPSADGEVVAVVAMPPPTSPIAIERDGVRARVLVPWSWPAAPRAFVVTDAGTRRLDVTQGARGAELTFDCTPGGSPTIEFEAGDLLVASVVNVCTPAPPSAASAVEVGPTARTAVEIEQRLFELINRDRVATGRAALAWDPQAHAMARRHSARMATLDFMGHVAPDGETLPDRVARARLPAAQTFENVGLADGPGRAHDAFLASPGHRRNLMIDEARRGAIGVAPSRREPGRFYVTEILFEPR